MPDLLPVMLPVLSMLILVIDESEKFCGIYSVYALINWSSLLESKLLFLEVPVAVPFTPPSDDVSKPPVPPDCPVLVSAYRLA